MRKKGRERRKKEEKRIVAEARVTDELSSPARVIICEGKWGLCHLLQDNPEKPVT
jgi:hypothetical protein